MRPEHRRLALILLALLALLSLLLFVTVPGKGLWHKALLDASHGPIFAAITLLLLLMRPPEARDSVQAQALAFGTAVALGGLIEILQTLGNRPGSWFDVTTDAIGAATGLALWHLVRRRRTAPSSSVRGAWPGWPLAVLLAGVGAIAWPPLQAARAYAGRAAEFPTIADFQGPRVPAFVESEGESAGIVELPAPWALAAGERALRITYRDGQPRSVQVVEPASDWRGHSTVAVDITNPGDAELRLTFRIFDAAHNMDHRDRFNLPVAIPPRTRSTVRVTLAAVESSPQSRRMDMARIADVMLFGQRGDGAGEFYVSRLWLE